MRRTHSAFLSLVFTASLLFGNFAANTSRAEAYNAKPKLVVIVVIDQFRSDYLQRYRAEFQGRGFRLMLDEGAWFPDCYYNYANTMTAPGHSTLGTGAYTDGHGIQANEFWDASRSWTHKVSSVEDERYSLVGIPEGSKTKSLPGASPLNLRATTVGDELRLATQGASRVYGISLKDRASILPAGQAANGAFWIDQQSGRFLTSTYYMTDLPAWAKAFNSGDARQRAATAAHWDGTGEFYEKVGVTPAANAYELAFAEAAIEGAKLGQSKTTDMLVVSLSANDIMGHKYGPDSEQEHDMVLGLDHDLNDFFTWLDQHVGLGNVWIALSADHGVAPAPGVASALGIHAATVNLKTLGKSVNATLNARFTPGKSVAYLMPGLDLPYFQLDKRVFAPGGAAASANVDEKTAEEALGTAIRAGIDEQNAALANAPVSDHRLPPMLQVVGTYTRLQLASGDLPNTPFGEELAHSYTDRGMWYTMLVLGGYQMQDLSSWGSKTGTTHFSPWNYDRHVPLAFYGAPFVAGTYRGRVEPVDLAATLASLLGINQPSAAIGHVLTQALKPSVPEQPISAKQ
uniref:Type I phosphodiesterase/nucleotide pyrophosphatase n=1 Tax=mine drainage metagenome TaxID=410659 RepID=E6QKR4_9ZZZZ